MGKFQLDRRLATKDRNHNLEALAFVVHLLDHTVEILEGAVVDLDPFANFEVDKRTWRVFTFLHTVQNLIHFGIAHRHRSALRTQEASYAVDRVDQVIPLVGHFHVHKNITRHKPTFRRDLFAPAHLNDLFGWNQNFINLVFKAVFNSRSPDCFSNLLFEV